MAIALAIAHFAHAGYQLAVLRWFLLAVAMTVAMPVQAMADTPPIVRLRSSKAPAKAPAAKKTAQASKGKRARKPVALKRSATKKKKSAKKPRERAEVIRPMP